MRRFDEADLCILEASGTLTEREEALIENIRGLEDDKYWLKLRVSELERHIRHLEENNW